MIPALAVFFLLLFTTSGLLMGLAALLPGHPNVAADPALWWVALSIVTAAGGAWHTWRLNGELPRPNFLQWAMLLFGLVVIARLALWSAYTDDAALMVLLPNNLGDYAFHASQTAYLVQQPAFPIPAQIVSGAPFAYPFGINWVAAGWISNGMDPVRSLSLTLLLAGTGMIFAAWSWSPRFGIAVVLLNGGIAGYAIVQGWDLSNYQDALMWKSIPLAMLGTQRGVVLGIGIGLMLLAWLRHQLSGKAETKPGIALPLWVVGLLYGTLPLFHMHSFAAISFTGLLAVVLQWRAGGQKTLLQLIVPGLVAAPFFWWATGGLTLGRQGGWAVGWWTEEEGFWGWTLVRNFGFWLLLGFVFLAGAFVPVARLWLAKWQLWSLSKGDAAVALLPGPLVIGLMTLFYRFQPWPWDNTKFMIWTYLIVGTLACEALLARARDYVKWPMILLLFLSGTVSLLGGLRPQNTGFELIQRPELTSVGEALAHLDVEERFVCNSAIDYQHPLMMQGARVVAGYEGHLWSHGYDFEKPLESAKRILGGDPAWLAHALRGQATAGFWGPREQGTYRGVNPPWAIPALRLVESGSFSIYRLQKPQKPTGRDFRQLWR